MGIGFRVSGTVGVLFRFNKYLDKDLEVLEGFVLGRRKELGFLDVIGRNSSRISFVEGNVVIFIKLFLISNFIFGIY